MFSIFLAMSRRHLFCGGECSEVGFWVPRCLGCERSGAARGEAPAAESEVSRFFLKKLLLGERKTSGC